MTLPADSYRENTLLACSRRICLPNLLRWYRYTSPLAAQETTKDIGWENLIPFPDVVEPVSCIAIGKTLVTRTRLGSLGFPRLNGWLCVISQVNGSTCQLSESCHAALWASYKQGKPSVSQVNEALSSWPTLLCSFEQPDEFGLSLARKYAILRGERVRRTELLLYEWIPASKNRSGLKNVLPVARGLTTK